LAAGKQSGTQATGAAITPAPSTEPEPEPEPEQVQEQEPEQVQEQEPDRLGLKAWPMQDRPRERMFSHGPAALSDTELLALLLRSGNRGSSAMNLARQLLHAHGALTGLLASSPQQMARLPGIGPAGAASLLAVMELARRAQRERLERKTLLGRPKAVKDYLCLLLHGRPQEVFMVLFLDSQNRLILADEMFRGTLNQTAVYPREVIRRALELNAAAVILAHNHPSGVAEPSQADRVLTDALRAALRHLDIPVLDHIIVAAGSTYSFAEHGYL
jgi:DNA repair protein RadC